MQIYVSCFRNIDTISIFRVVRSMLCLIGIYYPLRDLSMQLFFRHYLYTLKQFQPSRQMTNFFACKDQLPIGTRIIHFHLILWSLDFVRQMSSMSGMLACIL